MVAHLREGVPHALRTSQFHNHNHNSNNPSDYHGSINMDTTTTTTASIPRPSSNVDEGYSEDSSGPGFLSEESNRSPEDDSEMMFALNEPEKYVASLLRKVLELPAETRKCFAQDIVRSLPNTDKEAVKNLIEILTHFDPAAYFPNEIMLQILSYLSPRDLLAVSTVSHTWRLKSQDERLWQCCFAREGWILDQAAMRGWVEGRSAAAKAGADAGNRSVEEEGGLRRPSSLERRASRKRKTDEAFSEGEGGAAVTTSSVTGGAPSEGLQAKGSGSTAVTGAQQLSDQLVVDTDDDMEDVQNTTPASDSTTTATPADAENMVGIDSSAASLDPSADQTSFASQEQDQMQMQPFVASHFKLSPTVFQEGSPSDRPKLSWAYLYKQRRRLEHNWDRGRFTTFQIPHPDHPHEGHEECVYTIQHTTKHLVSGSRDKTIRIWDLETCRLIGKPLKAHEASVLCLQFDERPEHDIIVSGGSDTYVIIWRFSTGQVLAKMTNAHDESVLNLRFDDRYIVTCSKDKTIKIWSRRQLDRNSPLIPTHVLPHFNDPSLNPDLADPIKEFSLLATLTGHHAAVNAVMIHDTTIVSASGDRTIKGWDIHSGKHIKTYSGHSKGIACVQYDGRRIVSGSSDDSVRIFDADSQAEIACLKGHRDLVRTVQARFGDLVTTSSEELAAQAERVDAGFFRAMARGALPAGSSGAGMLGNASSSLSARGHGSASASASAASRAARSSAHNRNAGSSRPEDLQAVGSKIPPGGGGTRWARIVSGSYDESVILWKRDAEGKWTARHRLMQDSLSGRGSGGGGGGGGRRGRAAVGGAGAHQGNHHQPHQQPHHHHPVQQHAQQPGQTGVPPVLNPAAAVPPQITPGMSGAAFTAAMNAQMQHLIAAAQGHAASLGALMGESGPANPDGALMGAAANANANGNGNANAPAQQQPQQQTNGPATGGAANPTTSTAAANTSANPAVPAPAPPATAVAGPAAAPGTMQPAAVAAAAATPAPNNNNNHPHNSQRQYQQQGQQGQQTPNNRVFKLQFDARRILCCSQNKVIVGWDFANGDEELARIGEWSAETQ